MKRVIKNEEKTTILLSRTEKVKKLKEENEQLKNAIAIASKIEERIKEKFISKSKIEEKIAKLEGSCVVMDDWVCCALKDLLKESEE